jgi:hypothetical protein
LSYPAIGLNCGVTNQLSDENIVLRTTWSPRFVQPRILPREINLSLTFASLAIDRLAIETLAVLPQEYERWIAGEESRLRNAVREGLSSQEANIESRRLEQDIAAPR